MVRLIDLDNYIKKLAKSELAETWDNIGIIVGDKNQVIKRILICLDVTQHVVEEAIDKKIDLIISHHPLIFKGIKKLDFSNFKSKIIKSLILNDIAVIAAHTNLDAAQNGLNDYIALKLNLKNTSVLSKSKVNEQEGLGRVGFLENPLDIYDFINFVKEKLDLSYVKLVKSNHNKIKKIAVLGGSGASFIELLPSDIDMYLTGDITYHYAVDAKESGINLLDIGHYAEKIVKNLLKEYIEKNYSALDCEVFIAEHEEEPFEIL